MEQNHNQGTDKREQLLAEIATYLVIGYGGVIFLLWILQWLISEQAPYLGMVKSAIPLLLLPALILLPLCLLLRKWRLSLALVPAVAAFLISYGVFFLPRSQEAVSTFPLRIMTFNIQAPDEGEVASLVEIIRAADADVMAVQELSPAAADQFSAVLADLYPHQALHTEASYIHAGQGVLSRYPIVADEYWRYDQNQSALGHQRVVVEAPQSEVVFYNTHPIPPYSSAGFHAPQHTEALRDVLARANAERAPTVILGDFNMTDQFHEYRRIRETFTDAYRAVGDIGFGFTFPHDKWTGVPPLIRLDYIFYSPNWRGISADVWPGSGSSDHAPLLTQLSLSDSIAFVASFSWRAHEFKKATWPHLSDISTLSFK